jgi:hypothetical protein
MPMCKIPLEQTKILRNSILHIGMRKPGASKNQQKVFQRNKEIKKYK